MKEKLYRIEQEYFSEFQAIREFIYEHAELGNEEYISSRYLVQVLQKHGFVVEYPYLDIPTAFRAECTCTKGAKVAFLPEYDALPGYGPKQDEIKHACGHNWIAATCLGAAITLSKLKEELSGTIVVMGTPAEENTGGKCELVEKGAFKDIDAAIQMHLSANTSVDIHSLALDCIDFTFHGRASHSSAYPELGINALDAVQLMFMGVNALRQHTTHDTRIAGIILEGGKACNIVPERASCRFETRAKDRESLDILTQKVVNCAKGAALMSGTSVEFHRYGYAFDEMHYDEKLRASMKKHLKDLGIHDFKEGEGASGSSDIGNVSKVCPTVYGELATGILPEAHPHEEAFLQHVHGPNADRSMHIAIMAMALTALDSGLKNEGI